MSKTLLRPKFTRDALRVALCYVVALQAFLAAYSTAFAISEAGGTAVGLVICHNGDVDRPPDPHKGSPARIPCALCAMVALGDGLPLNPIVTIVPRPPVAYGLQPLEIAGLINSLPTRAGLARAPPKLA